MKTESLLETRLKRRRGAYYIPVADQKGFIQILRMPADTLDRRKGVVVKKTAIRHAPWFSYTIDQKGVLHRTPIAKPFKNWAQTRLPPWSIAQAERYVVANGEAQPQTFAGDFFNKRRFNGARLFHYWQALNYLAFKKPARRSLAEPVTAYVFWIYETMLRAKGWHLDPRDSWKWKGLTLGRFDEVSDLLECATKRYFAATPILPGYEEIRRTRMLALHARGSK